MNTQQPEENYTLDQIIEKAFDFSAYSDEEKQTIIAETSGMIMETSLLRSLDEGGADLQEKFTAFIDTEPNEEKMTEFIENNIPNFGDTVMDEIKKFKELGSEEKEPIAMTEVVAEQE